MQRKVQMVFTRGALENLGSDSSGVFQLAKELVRDPDVAAIDVGRYGVQTRAAVAQTASKEVAACKGEICVCCGAWWLFDETAPLPCGCAWPNYVDRTGHSEDVAWRIFRGNLGRLWGCPSCGAVFEQSGRLYRERLSLSLLSGVRVSGAWSDRWKDKAR